MRKVFLTILLSALVSTFSVFAEKVDSKTVATGSNWLVSETTELSKLIIENDATLDVPEGKILVLTVDGIQQNIEEGTYTGNIELTVADDNIITFSMGPSTMEHYFSQSIYIDENGLSKSKSVLSAVLDGDVNGSSAEDVKMVSDGDNFNGFYITGEETVYTIDNADVNFTGNGGNDFAGYGAAIMSDNGATVYVNNSTVTTKGALRTALLQNNASHMIIKNSEIKGYDGELPYYYLPNGMPGTMMNVPWPLGLGGNLRTTNLVGDGTKETLISSYIASERWGACSTDMGQNVTLTAIDTEIENLGDTGYGLYAIGNNSFVNVYGSEINVKDYATIIIGGVVNYGAITTELVSSLNNELGLNLTSAEINAIPEKETLVNSGRIGFMSHESTSTTVNIFDATEINCGEAIFVVRGVPTIVNVDGKDGVKLNAGVKKLQEPGFYTSGEKVIMQVMDLDKPQKGQYSWEGLEDSDSPFYNKSNLSVFTADYVEPCESYEDVEINTERDVTIAEEGKDVIGTFKNITLDGDFYNSTTGSNNANENYPLNLNTLEPVASFGGEYAGDTGNDLNLSLAFDNAVVNGMISASYANHINPHTGEITNKVESPIDLNLNGDGTYDFNNGYEETDSYKGVARVKNTPKPVKNNGVIVELINGTKWNIPKTCFLSKLTIDDTSSIVPPNGYKLKMTVNGEEKEIKPTSYEGEIVLIVSKS